MASLSEHNLTNLIDTYSLHTFVETGYGNGGSFRFAKQHGFLQWFSCDVIKESAMKGRDAWPEDCVAHCNSIAMVSAIQQARMVLGIDMGNVLWWLDAHFPGVDTGLMGWEESARIYGVESSCKEELETILSGPCGGDVIIIDDAFLFRAGITNQAFNERVPEQYRHSLGSLEDVLDRLAATHELQVNHEHTGSIALLPKKDLICC